MARVMAGLQLVSPAERLEWPERSCRTVRRSVTAELGMSVACVNTRPSKHLSCVNTRPGPGPVRPTDQARRTFQGKRPGVGASRPAKDRPMVHTHR
eukprot:5017128-Prymnesium_polylepis.1